MFEKNNEEKEAVCTEEILKNIKAASVTSELGKTLKYECTLCLVCLCNLFAFCEDCISTYRLVEGCY